MIKSIEKLRDGGSIVILLVFPAFQPYALDEKYRKEGVGIKIHYKTGKWTLFAGDVNNEHIDIDDRQDIKEKVIEWALAYELSVGHKVKKAIELTKKGINKS